MHRRERDNKHKVSIRASKTSEQTIMQFAPRVSHFSALVGSVRLSGTQHLTSRTIFRLAISTTYSTGSEGQKICVVFSENAPLQN